MNRQAAAIFVCVLWVLVGNAIAQGDEYRAVENPFQGDFQFTVNSDLRPMVEVDGVRWERFGVYVKGDREIEPDKNIPVTVELGFVNTNPDGVKILVIALFEDRNGHPLERVECERVGANSDRLKESTQKFKISGAVLNDVRRVYLFCEVER